MAVLHHPHPPFLPTGALALAEWFSLPGNGYLWTDPVDILACHLERQAPEYRAFRYNVGSFRLQPHIR